MRKRSPVCAAAVGASQPSTSPWALPTSTMRWNEYACDLIARRPVELGRPSGAGTGAPADALEAHVDHTRIRELVEVERRDGSRDVERAGGIVARHPPRRGDEKSIQVASQRLIQRGDARDPSVEIDAFIHEHILKEIILDARDGCLLLLEYSFLERLTS